MSIRVCDNCGIKEADYTVYDIENQQELSFCSRDCFEKYCETLKSLKVDGVINEEPIKDYLLRKDKEQLIELYLQKCYDINVEIEQLKAENERLKMEVSFEKEKKENALKFIGELQLKDNTEQVCDLCIIGEKAENSNEFNIIFQNRVFSYEQAKEMIKKYNLDLKIYKIVDLREIK